MRLFLGLPLPESYQDGLARLVAQCRKNETARFSWTRPGNWHLTLKFLGEVPGDKVPAMEGAVSQALSALPFRPFPFRAAGAGVFPSLPRPRVLWAGVSEGAEEAKGLAACLEEALMPHGFQRGERPFAPHLTVARIKEARREDVESVLMKMNTTGWPVVSMREVVLWRSALGGGGPAYTRLASFPAA